MPLLLSSLPSLRAQMEERSWMIFCLNFRYGKKDYFILLRRYSVKPPPYALIEICFVDRTELDRTLCGPANSAGIQISAKEIREYFRIKWTENLGEILQQLTAAVGLALPKDLPDRLSSEQEEALVHHLSRADSEDPRKVYCTGTRLNAEISSGERGKRSAFNSQKTEILRPLLYKHLKSDTARSFCYSADKAKEVSDDQILAKISDSQR